MREIMLKKLTLFIATFAFVGKIKYAPGTCGSIAGLIVMYLALLGLVQSGALLYLSLLFAVKEIIVLGAFFAILTLLLFVLGIFCSSYYVRYWASNNDPKEVVIDEVVGQMLTTLLCFFGSIMLNKTALAAKLGEPALNFIFIALLPFILFRIFDILKPWPIDYIDQKVKGGLGIMLDDVVAGLFAFVVFYLIVFNILKFFPIIYA